MAAGGGLGAAWPDVEGGFSAEERLAELNQHKEDMELKLAEVSNALASGAERLIVALQEDLEHAHELHWPIPPCSRLQEGSHRASPAPWQPAEARKAVEVVTATSS